MAPEQARGETEALDERCDVFGLGALLCEILTGKPPYRAAEYRTPLSQAQSGDLAEAFARLGRCGADADLIDLARACLAPARDGRPPDAGAVAAARRLTSTRWRPGCGRPSWSRPRPAPARPRSASGGADGGPGRRAAGAVAGRGRGRPVVFPRPGRAGGARRGGGRRT